MEQRLTDMEMLIMHQGHVIEQLNEVVTGHQSKLEHLAKELKVIKEQCLRQQAPLRRGTTSALLMFAGWPV
jgi:uncharacterized coiled-coil protein SlyX